MPDTTVCDAYFNSRPHGGRQNIVFLFLFTRHFNSRPHGGRPFRSSHPPCSTNFNSRPHGGRRGSTTPQYPVWNISNHALTEGDVLAVFLPYILGYFNSRPHGGRLILCIVLVKTFLFQLTPSRRATANLDKFFF